MPILIVMNKPYNDDEALRTVVNYVKRVDGSDVYDEHISYNILKIKEI